MPLSDKSNSRFKLFSLLAAAGSRTVPSAYLKENLGISRQGVFKTVQALRDEGLKIESIPQKGYALKNVDEADVMSPTLIDYLLRDNEIFTKCVYFPEVDSTQHILKKMAQQGAPEGVVATTDQQTQGRGRRGRAWFSPYGKNLYFSALLRPRIAPGDVQLLNLAAGAAVLRVLKERHGIAAGLKWPNDVMASGKKICGILSEAAGEPDRVYYTITGIGVNANLSREDLSAEIAGTATSMLIESGKRIARPFLLAQIFSGFAELSSLLRDENGKARLLEIYRENCSTLGRQVRVTDDDQEFIGTAKDVTEQGALIVNVKNMDKVFAAADVHHLRLMD